jgi:hypothetical protein
MKPNSLICPDCKATLILPGELACDNLPNLRISCKKDHHYIFFEVESKAGDQPTKFTIEDAMKQIEDRMRNSNGPQ